MDDLFESSAIIEERGQKIILSRHVLTIKGKDENFLGLFSDMLLLMAAVGIFAWSGKQVSIRKEKIATTVQRNIKMVRIRHWKKYRKGRREEDGQDL
jgi:hypothetical protein